MSDTSSSLSAVPGVVPVSSVAGTTPATLSQPVPQKGSTVLDTVVKYLTSSSFLHLAGLVAVSVLTGVGTIPVNEGFPIIVGATALGINTTSGQ